MGRSACTGRIALCKWRDQFHLLEDAMIRVNLLCFALIALTACETAKGAGRDIEKAGDAIADTAQNVQNSL